MPNKRTILIEAALVVGVLFAGISATNAAHAAQATPSPAATDPRASVMIESKILVERTAKGDDGQDVVTLHSPTEVKVIPGDRLIFVNKYRNTAATPVTGFVVNNPIHSAVNFVAVDEDWALVSVDGGKNFGKLEQLTVKDQASGDDGEESALAGQVDRAATPADVTQVRWAFAKPIAPGESGELRFRVVVK